MIGFLLVFLAWERIHRPCKSDWQAQPWEGRTSAPVSGRICYVVQVSDRKSWLEWPDCKGIMLLSWRMFRWVFLSVCSSCCAALAPLQIVSVSACAWVFPFGWTQSSTFQLQTQHVQTSRRKGHEAINVWLTGIFNFVRETVRTSGQQPKKQWDTGWVKVTFFDEAEVCLVEVWPASQVVEKQGIATVWIY